MNIANYQFACIEDNDDNILLLRCVIYVGRHSLLGVIYMFAGKEMRTFMAFDSIAVRFLL
jgi:hypothetical protein